MWGLVYYSVLRCLRGSGLVGAGSGGSVILRCFLGLDGLFSLCLVVCFAVGFVRGFWGVAPGFSGLGTCRFLDLCCCEVC